MTGDKIEHENIGDAIKSSPFNLFNIFKGFTGGASGSRGPETGGGMGEKFNGPMAQADIDINQPKPIYPTSSLD